MLGWIERKSKLLQALSSVATVGVAIVAVIGVTWQIDASYELQQQQSARDIYREFLNISISNPDLSKPNYCALAQSPRSKSYEAYVEYMLYTAEQTLEIDPTAKPIFEENLSTHKAYICSHHNAATYSEDVQDMLKSFTSTSCENVTMCS